MQVWIVYFCRFEQRGPRGFGRHVEGRTAVDAPNKMTGSPQRHNGFYR